MGTFTQDIEKFKAETQRKLDLSLRRTAIDIGSRIIFRTPVDTGLARNNWMPSISAPSIETTPYKGKEGAAVRARLVSNVGQWKPIDGASFFFTNNLPYIEVLEKGRIGNKGSSQAPQGMVAITVAEFQNIVDASVRGL